MDWPRVILPETSNLISILQDRIEFSQKEVYNLILHIDTETVIYFLARSTDKINLVIILRIKILNLHISVFSVLNAVVNLSQHILYTAKDKSTFTL